MMVRVIAITFITLFAATGVGHAMNAKLASELALLEQEADRIESAHDIRRLQRAYGYYLDQAMWDEMADLFTQNGTIEIGLDGVYVGQKRIREYLYALGGGRRGLKQGELKEHLQLQPVIDVAPDARTAQGRWRAFIMSGQLGESARWGEGPYEVEYARENGVWKISKLHWYQTFIVAYDGGWAKNKDLTNGIAVSKQLPPDRPPTERYGVWPEVYIPPFHYRNPTTSSMPTITEPALADLAQHVRALHDRDAIENLVSMYGYYLDKQQWDLLTDLFTEDGTMEISQRGVYVGHKSIRRSLELFGPQNIEPNHVHNHIQLQPVITVAPDGTRAWVRSRALSELGTFNSVGAWGDGVYENEFVKVNGVWKIHVDHVYTTFFAATDKGWAFGSRPTPKMSERIPNDHPPTEKYESFPDFYIPKFHYENGASIASTIPVKLSLDKVPASERKRMEQLARKVERMHDANAIENLQRAYGFFVDKCLWKEASELFADDGTLEIGGRGVFVGKPRILEYLKYLAPEGMKQGLLMNHLQLQPIVHVGADGSTAKGRWRFLAEVGEWQKSQMWGAGVYENEYVKQNGVWKIRTLHAYFRMYTPYAEGWGKTAMPNTRPEKDLPPDRPPTLVYDTYPGTFVPPFHYRHPVTGK
jgi:hypothetical protein